MPKKAVEIQFDATFRETSQFCPANYEVLLCFQGAHTLRDPEHVGKSFDNTSKSFSPKTRKKLQISSNFERQRQKIDDGIQLTLWKVKVGFFSNI